MDNRLELSKRLEVLDEKLDFVTGLAIEAIALVAGCVGYFALSHGLSHTEAEVGGVALFLVVRWGQGWRLRDQLKRRTALRWPPVPATDR